MKTMTISGKVISFIAAMVVFTGLYAQTDAKAKSILDQLSAKTKAYSSIKADFNYTLDNQEAEIHETQSGSIALKGNKYFLKIAGQEVISDGSTVWTYLKDAEEVQISEMETDNEDQITPSNIFTMYEKGFRHQFIKEEASTYIIHIFPLDLDMKSYHTVKLHINKAKMELSKVIILGKEGDTYTYVIKSFQSNVSLNDSMFKFNKADHPGVDVIDLR